jgi:hypothetical protein
MRTGSLDAEVLVCVLDNRALDMGHWRFIFHFFLAAIVFASACCVQVSVQGDTGKQQSPADQPLDDSEEKEELRGEAGEFLLASLEQCIVQEVVTFQWTPVPSDVWVSFAPHSYRPDLSRAPPAA